ncbi:Glucose-1-phosphatase [Eumeta japonica]|uniref:Glucose-1-phosphatase n=1 Tax=Eumeta variegata TaxID=151549 RepID=A0A4C1VVW8_EUMVA|nr:Glucose-1-phosphatase [Eumeta japonica]
MLDRNLHFKDYIERVTKIAIFYRGRLGVMFDRKSKLSLRYKRTIYKMYIRSVITNASLLFAYAAPKALDRLQVIQNKFCIDATKAHCLVLNLWWIISLVTLVLADDYELDKVLVFSRHNVRAPLGNAYPRYSSRPWPSWSDEVGTLTHRGHLLEKNIAKYFSLWLQEEKLSIDCPKDVTIYTNNYERTISSGFAFAEGAFPKCALNIRYKNRTTIDPIFSLDSRNLTRKFEEEVQEYMKNKLLSIDFKNSLELVQNIIDLKNSPKCKEEGVCDLVSGEHMINIKPNIEPVLSGPIAIANKLVDTFLMQYYNGFDTKNVAWGLIKNETEWKTLLDINKYYHDIIFNETNIARDISLPLVKFLKESLLNDTTKFNYLVGHDGNIFTMFRIMNFKPYELPDNYEITPIGGKVVFQKWYDRESDRFLLKIEYVYASFNQMRDMQELSLENPPKRVTLEMEGCPVDRNGFCLWTDFLKKMEEF